MKLLHASLIACSIAAFAGTAMASSGSLVEFKPDIMPVVVQVDAHGQVTDVLPSRQLSPWLRKMLVKQLDAWIVKPAAVKGHAVASRFIIEVAMQAKPRQDGQYDANFVYVKSLPLAYGGALHWAVINGGLELALVSDMGGHERQVFDTTDRWPRNYQPAHARQPVNGGGTPRPESHAADRTSSPPTMAAAPQAAPRSAATNSNETPRTARQ